MKRPSLQRIEHWLWYAFLAIFAWQTRIIFWQADLKFIEWRAGFLYASDILMFGLFALALWDLAKGRAWKVRGAPDALNLMLMAFVFAALASIHNTDDITVSVYQFLRLCQFVLFYFYVRYRAVHFNSDASLAAFVVGALGQSALALGQYAVQHDIGLRWLGETLLNPQMKGVAVFYDLTNTKILRAYGTLPHPNVLAAYLMTASWALGYLYLRHASNRDRLERLVWGAAGVIILWAMYLTFSRTMIVIWVGGTGVMAYLLWHARLARDWPNVSVIRLRARRALIFTAAVSLVFAGLFWRQVIARAAISSKEEAVTLRVYYAEKAIASGKSAWLNVNFTGVGLGNFVGWLRRADPSQPPWVFQPAHNLYLLVFSETGAIGLGLFLAWLALTLRHAAHNKTRPGLVRWGIVTILLSFLAISMFDHFFWTIQQGRILFWLMLAVAAA